jgi:hypothetical protein
MVSLPNILDANGTIEMKLIDRVNEMTVLLNDKITVNQIFI